MGALTLESTWNAFGAKGNTPTVVSPWEFRDNWLWGIPLTSANGAYLTDDIINDRLTYNQSYIEDYLNIKLFKQTVEESQDFNLTHFRMWSFIKTNLPINNPLELRGRLNESDIINYPKEWLTIARGNNTNQANNLYIVPNGGGTMTTFDVIKITFTQHYFTLGSMQNIPNYWWIKYETGFNRIPSDIIRLICLITTIDILLLIELGIGANGGGGVSFGAASTSLSLDGMSQSISKINGGNLFKSRIEQHAKDVDVMITQMRMAYGGIKFDVC